MQIKSLISASGIIAIGMVAGRLLGLLREIAIAAYFGISGQADIAILLLMLPDFVAGVFIGSAGSAALIPAFSTRTKPQALALLRQMLWLSAVSFSVIATVLLLYSQFGNWLPVSDYSILFFTFFSIPLMGVTAIFSAWLQYIGRFTVPAFATVIFNITILCSLWLATGDIKLLAVGIFTASLFRLLAHIIAFFCCDESFGNIEKSNWEIDRKLLYTYTQAAITGVIGMLPLYAPYLILTATTGGLALFNYAFKLVLLPTIFLQTIIQMVLLPLLVKQLPELRTKTHNLGLHIGYVCGVSVACAVMLVSKPIIAFCFGHGKISPQNIADIVTLLQIGIWATPFAVSSCLWQQMLYAENQAKSAMFASVVGAVLLLPLYYFGQNIYGEIGLMIGFVVINIIQLLLVVVFGKRHIPLASFLPSKDYIFSTLAMLGIFAISALLYVEFLAITTVSDIIKLIIGISVGGLMLGGVLFVFIVIQWFKRL